MPEARIQSLTGVSTPLATSSIMAMEDTRFKKSGLLVISSAITVFDSLAEPFFLAVCCTAAADCPKTLQRITVQGALGGLVPVRPAGRIYFPLVMAWSY